MSSGPDPETTTPRASPSGQSRLRSWPETLLDAVSAIARVTPERRATVQREIDQGSAPTAVYYVLLGLSELIAGFALIIDSDATLIGANVVAPLMTPIFGVSLGLMRGDLRLLRKGLLAEFGGAAFGVGLCFILGLMPFMGEPSAALLAQTRPTLIDLFVAALAGFAGVLAMIDERISPALPGVAIATALNPPIAAIGLCLALGAYSGAWGAFLLFFANVLAILAVAVVLFLVAGFVTREEMGSMRGLARRFAPAVIGLVLVTGLLTSYLVGLVRNLRSERSIRSVLDSALAQEPNTALVSVEFDHTDGAVDVLSTVRTPHVIEPASVKTIQDRLSAELDEPVRLFMRCVLTKDVTATGSTSVRPYLSLDGKVTEAPLSPAMRLLQQAEQVAREVASGRPGMSLTDVRLIQLASGPVFVVSIESTRQTEASDVAAFEDLLRTRLGEPSVRVVVRKGLSTDVSSKGRILFGEAHFGDASPEEIARRGEIETAVRAGVEALPDMFVTALDAIRRDGRWMVRGEVVGARILTPADVKDVEARLTASLGEPLNLSLWTRADLQVTSRGYERLGNTAD